MTRRRGVRAEEDEGLRILGDCFAPVCTIVGKTWALHLEKVVRVDRAENLAMIEESVAFLAGAGKRVIYDAEHFFDGFRDDRAYALDVPRGGRARRGGHGRACATRTARRCPHQVAEATRRGGGRARATAVRVGFHGHNDAECGVANTLTAVDAGARQVQGTMNGVGERTGNANLVSIIANLQLKMGHDVVAAGAPGASSPRSRTSSTSCCNLTPDPNQPYVGKNAFAHKGGLHVAGVRADAATFEHVDPDARRQPPRAADLRAVRPRHGRREGRRRGPRPSTTRPPRGSSSASRTSSTRGYHFEAADGSFELLMRRESGEYEPLFTLESWRVIVEKRADGKVETEATIKIWVDGERYVRTAEGNGPVNALDAALRDAIARDPPAPARHRARQLQGPHPRREPRHRRGHARAHRRLRRPGRVGRDRRSTRTSSPPRGRRSSTRSSTPSSRPRTRRPRRDGPRRRERVSGVRRRRSRSRARSSGEAEERAVARGPALGPALARPARPGLRGGLRRRASASPTPAPSRAAPPGLHLALRAVGVADGDEVVTSPFSFVASANVCVFERAGPVFADIDPVTLNLDPRRGGRGGHRAHDRAPAGPHLRLPGRPARLRAPRAADRRGRLRGARRRPRRRRRGRRARPPGRLRLLRQQAADDGRGRDGHDWPTGRSKERIDSERNQGRAPDMGWLDHDRLGFNYRLSDLALRARPRPARAPRRHARRPRAGRRALPRGARRRRRGPRAALPGRRRRTSAAGSSSSSRSRTATTATTVIARAARRAGVQSKPYLPGDPPDVLLPRDVRPPRRASSRSARTSRRGRSRCPFFPG